MQLYYLMNWPNIKVLIKMTNRTELKETKMIAKRYRKLRKKVDVLVTFEMIFFRKNRMILAHFITNRKILKFKGFKH